MGNKYMHQLLYKIKDKNSIKYVVTGVIGIAIVFALIWRIQCTIYFWLDEVFNIEVSYLTAVLGHKHLVENDYIFSMGDLFSVPFIYLYHLISGGTEGIVLFIRFVYLGLNSLLALFFYKTFHESLGKFTTMLFGLIFITFFPGGIYTMTYDTMALYFGLLGAIALSGARLKENGKACIYLYAAGIFHACMVYAYPFMVISVFLVWIVMVVMQLAKEKKPVPDIIRYWLPYLLGGLTIVGIFLIYLCCVGVQNVFIFDNQFTTNYLSGRTAATIVGDAASASGVASAGGVAAAGSVAFRETRLYKLLVKLLECLNWMWIQQKPTLLFTIVMLIQWGIGLVKKGKWRLLLLPEIILVAFITHTTDMTWAFSTSFAYLCCWTPFLFFYLDDDVKEKAALLVIFDVTAIADFIAVSYTALYPNKSHLGLYCGGIFAIVEMLFIVKKKTCFGVPVAWLLVLLTACCNLSVSYLVPCSGSQVADCTYRIREGVYKGLTASEEDARYEKLRQDIRQAELDDNTRITMDNPDYLCVYLEVGRVPTSKEYSALKRFVYHTYRNNKHEGFLNDETIEAIYDVYMQTDMENWPDVIIVDKAPVDSYQKVKQLIWDEYYYVYSDQYDYLIYIKKE